MVEGSTEIKLLNHGETPSSSFGGLKFTNVVRRATEISAVAHATYIIWTSSTSISPLVRHPDVVGCRRPREIFESTLADLFSPQPPRVHNVRRCHPNHKRTHEALRKKTFTSDFQYRPPLDDLRLLRNVEKGCLMGRRFSRRVRDSAILGNYCLR